MHSTLRHTFGLALFMRRGVTTWISKSSHGWRADVNVAAHSRMGKEAANKRERMRKKEAGRERRKDGGRQGEEVRQVLIGDYGYVKSESSV